MLPTTSITMHQGAPGEHKSETLGKSKFWDMNPYYLERRVEDGFQSVQVLMIRKWRNALLYPKLCVYKHH